MLDRRREVIAVALLVIFASAVAEDVFDTLDLNHDGMLDRTEYAQGLTKLQAFLKQPAPSTAALSSLSSTFQWQLPSLTLEGFWKAFTSSFAMILATEIGDKTFFIAAVLSMKHSRSAVFLGAILALAIMTGYGLSFMIGVPFTSMTQILPFIMFGIGLDNAFIISGEYGRTDKLNPPVERIHDTIDEVGLSIFLTTTTSIVAFALGCMSSVPALLWLCLYAAPTILINFF